MDNFNVDDLVVFDLKFMHMFVFTMGPNAPLGHNVLFPCNLIFWYPYSSPHCKRDLKTILSLHLVDNVLRILTPTLPK